MAAKDQSEAGDDDVTGLLKRWSRGEPDALDHLMPVVLGHVRDLAARALFGEHREHTLQPTALVNEVYLRLVSRRSVSWQNREQFFGFLADLMRRILIDHARRLKTRKRGGDMAFVPLDGIDVAVATAPELPALNDALDVLREIEPRQARVVDLKFFMGLENRETAEILGISVATVERDWKAAKAWLYWQMRAAS